MATVQERVAERYPDLLPLLRHPEVGRLLTQAVDPNKPLSQGSFMSKLRATRWFRSQSESQRRWWVTARMDPGEAGLQRRVMQQDIASIARQMGITPSRAQLERIREQALQHGQTADSSAIRIALSHLGLQGRGGEGAWRTVSNEFREWKKREFFAEESNANIQKWTQLIVSGQRTMEDYMAGVTRSATARFPHMAEQLKAGYTIREITEPAITAYAREMDWDPQGVMAKMSTNPQFAGLTGIKDPKTGQMRLPTEHEAMVMARKRADWWGTTRGREADNGMARTLLNAFGVRKG